MLPVTQVILIAPDINYPFTTSRGSYSDAGQKNGNVGILSSIKANYETHISKYGRMFQIPASFIASFIATESSGRNVGANKYKATGLMQITPAAFYDTFSARLRTGDIPIDQQSLVSSKVPGMNFSSRGISNSLGSIEQKLIAAFSDPEFNIYAGCLYMDFLIDRFAIDGVAQINKVLVGYNAGAYLKVLVSNIAIALDSGNLSRNKLVPAESRGYLVKILGIDGYLDLILNQKLVSFS